MNLELQNTLDEVKKLKEVEAITLYGSYARGDHDDASDIDLLILFKNKEDLISSKEKILNIRSRSKLFIQLTMFTLDELFNDCNPIFVRSILRHGKTVFQRYPDEIEKRVKAFVAKYPELFRRFGL